MVRLLAHFLPRKFTSLDRGVCGMRLYVVQVYALQLNIKQVESCLTLNCYTI